MTFEQREHIRQFYTENMARIMVPQVGWGIDKYRIPFLSEMSPIERIAFNECIGAGVPMYPEFPVGKYFIDLGNPRNKIGLELDGLEFHQDMHKDGLRDAELWRGHQWRIFRSTGGRCNVSRKMPSESDEREMIAWLHATVDGLIYALQRVYFSGLHDGDDLAPLDCMCIDELDRSRIINDFPILLPMEASARAKIA